ncbi:hypothetical protein [Mucilaginibacter myungsuensis]|uniref:Uncharacterized protein n=1 Tax=Mucilaginibacter myungsuensis TaxID=649104 RepID=A0A929KZF7_9SPHI|nr:hypothetical protein [Mucilaginibacter myungsuensis]MBE9663437.1 hypothetical protein [Mucilaginibacter myungsuensis]MDN3600175.1 hypothetical protein [Mucilaginibacter myungsuensis]
MEQTPTTKKGMPRWPFVLTLILVLLAGGGYYAYQRFLGGNKWKTLLQEQMKDLVASSTDSLYRIEYSDFDLNITSGNATLTDFKLVPDTNVYNKMVADKKAPDNLFTLGVKKLSIKNVGAKKAYQEKVLNIHDIIIENPDLTIVNKRMAYNDTVKVGKPKTPYEIIKKIFKRLQIDTIGLKNISLTYINKSGPVTKTNAIKNLDIGVSQILIDSLSAQDPERFYYTKGVQFTLRDYKLATADSLYLVKVKQLQFSTAQRSLILTKPALVPRYDKKAFYRKIKRADDRFDLAFERIAITDVDLQRFLRDQKLYAGLLYINKGRVEIYHDGRYKGGPKTSKIGKDPHQQLQKVALDMKIARIRLEKTSITYAETDATSGITGVINFDHTTGDFTNVTNDPEAKKLNHFMTARIRTSFLNAAPLSVNFKFDLNDKAGAFNYNGTLSNLDGRKLDKLLRPLAMVHIKSADIKRLHFNVNANNYSGKGGLEFYYKNLNVELLKKDTATNKLVAQGFISKIANSLVIDNDNPDKKGNFRPGPINLKRDPTVSFFSFLYKGLLDGIKPSVGFSKKTENNITTAVEKVSGVLSKFKEFKENRKKRREEKKKAEAIEEQKEQEQKEKEKAEKEKKKAEEKAKKQQEQEQKENTP